MDLIIKTAEEPYPVWLFILCAPCKPPMPYACVVASVGQAEIITESI